MPILLSSPCPRPNSPGSGASTCFISDTIEGVKHSLVCRKSFLGNHVSNQTNKIIIRNFLGTFSEFLNFIVKSIRCWIREEILWLPTLLNWLKMQQQIISSPTIKRLEYFHLLRWHRMCNLDMDLLWRSKCLLALNLGGGGGGGGDGEDPEAAGPAGGASGGGERGRDERSTQRVGDHGLDLET